MKPHRLLLIALDIPIDLCNPVILIAFGAPLPLFAIVPVPKATVHKYRKFPPYPSEVWLAWDIAAMYAVTRET